MVRTKKTNTRSSNRNILWKTALYIRLSKEDGNDISLSVINQKQRLLDFIGKNSGEFELVKAFIDDGYTGTDSNRNAFQNMLEEIRAKKINCVIVKDPSRLSRNYIEAGHYMEQLFVDFDVRFISLELPVLDSYKCPEQMNSIMVPIQNVINDDFCRQTSVKIRNVFDMKRENGEFIGAFAPYGYKKNPKDRHSLLIDEEAAGVVKDIYAWYVYGGMSKSGIVKKLNILGVSSPAMYKKQKGMKYSNPNCNTISGLWSTRTVTGILSNPTYLGHMVQGRQKVKSYKVHTKTAMPKEEWFYVENTQEPLVTQELFDKAGNLQERDVRTAPGQDGLYLFSGFVRCADCNKSMTRRTSKNHVYYACRTYTEQSNDKCTKHSIRLDVMEKAVLEAVRVQIKLIDAVENIIDAINEAAADTQKSKKIEYLLKKNEKELFKNTDIADNLYTDWKCGNLTEAEYRRMKIKFTEEMNRLTLIINCLQEECRNMESGKSANYPTLEDFLKYRNIVKLDRGILTELVNVIYIHEGGKLTIEFNFADPYKQKSIPKG